MRKEEIRKIFLRLPLKELGKLPKDDEIFEKSIQGVHFKSTKEKIFEGMAFYFLSISGNYLECQRIIKNFIEAVGNPILRYTSSFFPHIEFVVWDANIIDKKWR